LPLFSGSFASGASGLFELIMQPLIKHINAFSLITHIFMPGCHPLLYIKYQFTLHHIKTEQLFLVILVFAYNACPDWDMTGFTVLIWH
jgi:hypothetical protein